MNRTTKISGTFRSNSGMIWYEIDEIETEWRWLVVTPTKTMHGTATTCKRAINAVFSNALKESE